MKKFVTVTGAAELTKALRALPDRVSNRVLKAALLEGGEPIRASGSSFAPRAPGAPDMADHIVMHLARREKKGDVAAVVGPANEKRTDTGVNYSVQGLMVETGTARTSAQPFMRPAFETQQARSLQTILGSLWRSLIGHGMLGARGPQGSSESIVGPGAPSVRGGPGGSTL